MDIINIFHSKILKIYNTTVFIILRINRLPKCIIKHIIIYFCNSEPFDVLKTRKSNPGDKDCPYLSENPDNINIFPVYYPNRVFYSSICKIHHKCLIINNFEFGNNNCIIDKNFSAHLTLLVFDLKNTEVPNENIIAIANVLVHVLKTEDLIYNFNIPLFGNHFTEIIKKNKRLLIKVILAEQELRIISKRYKRLLEEITLI